jgi:mannonate dehydratase
MLHEPGKEIYDVIRYLGSRQKIFNVHFRNIRGHRDGFVETDPDGGDVDLVKAIQTYKEVGYPYLLMPDHVPTAPGDPGGLHVSAGIKHPHFCRFCRSAPPSAWAETR